MTTKLEMTDQPQITIKEALNLVEFEFIEGVWRVKHVTCTVWGDVYGNVKGNVLCNVLGNVGGYVGGDVGGTINGREWEFVETPKEKLKRLIEEGADKEQLLEAFNQLEES